MTPQVRFHPLATAEVVDAQRWYEDRVDGLGDRFLGALRAATDRAARWPNAGAPIGQESGGPVLERKIGIAGFPYVIVYRSTGPELAVLAVHHERRRPFYWVDRMNEQPVSRREVRATETESGSEHMIFSDDDQER